VSQPMRAWAEHLGIEMSDDWSMKARCLPTEEVQVRKMKDEMQRLTNVVRRKAVKKEKVIATKDFADWAADEWVDGLVAGYDDAAWRMRWRLWVSKRPGAVKEEDVEVLRESVSGFVRSHVDKNQGDGLIMCPRAYYLGLMGMADGMKKLSGIETSSIFNEIGIIGNQLSHLPFASLRRTSTHEFGVLRHWPKMKSAKTSAEFADYKWRPLVSFRKHRWRKVLALVSKW
jgi:hypothetical protein